MAPAIVAEAGATDASAGVRGIRRPTIVKDEAGSLLTPPVRTKPVRPPTPRPAADRATTDRARVPKPVPGDGVLPINLQSLLPTSRRKPGSLGIWLSFLLMVLLPTAVASVYYGFIASNQYLSEFRFAVRNQDFNGAGASAASSALGAAARAGAYTDNFLVVDYLNSRQAVEDLLKNIDIRQVYSSPEADRWSRFNATGTMEDLVAYWQSKIDASFDLATGLALVRIRAFSPDDAFNIASALVSQSEKLVNEISARARFDAVKFAEGDVRRAEDRLRGARAEMRQFRDTQQTPDAARTAGGTLDLAMKLRGELATMQTQLKSLRSYMDPGAPTVKVLESKIAATNTQLAAIEREIGKGAAAPVAVTPGQKPAADGKAQPGVAAPAALSDVLSNYEDVDLSRQFAEKNYDTTLATLELARSQAASQQTYVATYVQPSVAQASLYPQRLISILIVMLAAAALWFVSIMIFYSIRDHVV